MLELFVLMLCGSIITSGILAVRLRSLMAAMVSAGLASLFAAVCYVLLAAPDVAMTEASIGSGLSMLIFLLSLGGIPFVAGFWAKLYVFWAAIERGMYGLVFLGAVLTVVALYYYLLVARRMYIEAPPRTEPVPVPRLLGVAILACVVGVVGMGLYPAPWVTWAQHVASTLFS